LDLVLYLGRLLFRRPAVVIWCEPLKRLHIITKETKIVQKRMNEGEFRQLRERGVVKILSVNNTREARDGSRTFDKVGRGRSRERGPTASHWAGGFSGGELTNCRRLNNLGLT